MDGTAVAQWLRCCATNRKVAYLVPAGVIRIFPWRKIFPIALWPSGRLSLKQKWVPRAFPGGKGCRCVRLRTLQLSCAVVMKSGNLNFLELSGPLQACNGTALPFTLMMEVTCFSKMLVQLELQLYIPLEILLHGHYCDSLISRACDTVFSCVIICSNF